MTVLQAFHAILAKICAFGAGLFMALLFAIVFVNALMRYTIGSSFEWGDELPVYLCIYGMMFGVAHAYLYDRNINFRVVVDLLPQRLRLWTGAAVHLVVAACCVLFAWSGYSFVARRGGVEASGIVGQARDLAEATGLPWINVFGQMAFWQSSTILGGILIAAAACLKFVESLAAVRITERDR